MDTLRAASNAQKSRARNNVISSECYRCQYDLLNKLQDIEYSKRVFGIQYPFLLETLPEQAREPRYWGKLYQVNLSYFRITSEWHEDRSRGKFLKFIKKQGIDFVH